MLDETLFMEARLFRLFRDRMNLSAKEANRIFESYGIWLFIENCYDSLHLEGDDAAFEEIKTKLTREGATA